MFIGHKLYHKIVDSKIKEEKSKPPIEKAITALKLLEAKDLKEQLDFKEYYSKLTEIVKNYFEEDISLDALESTTDELIDKLELMKDSGKLSLDTKTIQNFKSVLKTADLVKFAKSNPGVNLAFSDKKLLETVLLDTKKAIPALTDEELKKNKEYLENLKKEKRKIIIKKFFILTFSLTILIFISSIAIYGWKNVADTLLGNPTKTLLAKTWIKSSYGAYPITLETPNALKRKESKDSSQIFEWISTKSNMSVFLKIEPNSKTTEKEDKQSIVNELIEQLEKNGAKNILTKDDELLLGNGVNAFKIFGSFDHLNKNNEVNRKEYVSLKFKENQGEQTILIVYERNDSYAKEIVKKIEESIIFEM
jgi:hypothetical protein